MEGRPNYSYLKFFAQEVILETGLSLSRVRATCREVIDYALTNYKALDICASCIAFIELLGQDSLPLRASLIAANMLHDSRILEGDSDYDKSFPDIGRKFKQAYIDKTHALSLVSELENIILNKWNPFNCDADSLFQDVILWMPAMTISHLYEVEAGNHYLYECAKQNKWLQFLVFAQIFQIPKEQVLKAASRFSNSCISYHIFHSLHRKSSLLYDVAYETKSVSSLKSQKKDMRRSLYTRIGVIKDAPVESKKNTEPDDDKISVTSEETSTSSDTDLRSYVLKDLFSQLLLAHGTDSPSDCLLHTCYEIQNPILAALAASYPEAPIEACFFMWLYTSLSHNETIQKQLETFFPELRIPNINTDDLENLIVIAIHHHKILTLWQGVHIFLPSTPLPSLMGFLRSFIVYKRFDSSIEAFQNKLWDYPKNTEKSSVLHSLFWIENISVTILKEVVISCSSNYERQLLLRHFSHTRLEKSFSKEVVVPQFIKVYHMRQCLGDVAQDIDVKNLFLPEHDRQYKATCWEAITKLLQHHSYEDAQLFSEHAKLPQDQMLMLQINQETDEARVSPSWQDLHIRIHFWQNLILKLQVLSLHTAVDFLEVQCEISDMHGEKYFLIKSIIDMIKDNLIQGSTDGTIYNLDSLNKKMWWFCIKAEVNNELLPEIFDVKAVFELNIQEIFFSKKVQPNPCCIEDEKEKEALGSIIGRFLSKSDIHSAFQLALTFGYDSLDLKIIKLCFEVAKGEINIDSVDRSMPDCSNDIASTRVIQSLILWVNKKSTDLTPLQKSIIQCIKDLSLKCIIAVKICYRILVHYIVSLILKEDFINVAQEKNAFSILKKILVLKLNDELVIAKSFIVVRDLSDKEVAEFLSEEIWNSLKILRSYDLVKIPEDESAFSEQVIYDPLRANEGFQLIVKLCQNPSVLGYSLMSIYSTESAELNYKSSDADFTVLVDLCICAHECFTAACNMDGISQILHNAQTLVTLLEEAEKFSTMVHLLTGLDRYSEMMYVFDILKSHDKFSILFEKKMDNMPNLRLALLDYLKKYPPSENDNYFYTLANRFGMHREKAEILEMSVQKLLSQLCKKNSALDSDMKDELENALQILSDAAKSYCMADCLHQAQNCTRLAQLVALQIYFVPDGVWIIGLDETSVARFITDHNKFSQAFIVAEEYGNHHLWSQALLHNVVIRGDRDYLLEFQAHFGLPTSLISDVVKRYKKLPSKNESTTRNMKLLLSMCSNIKVKYSLAHEMGFSDVLSELLMGEASSYLQDLIANNSIK
nr:spatacsin [Parasteatoda tepidariorum]